MSRYEHIYETACVSIEAQTPHAVRAGRSDATHDVLLARDANGLPYIPGTSLAGVLRHMYEDRFGVGKTRALFGYVEGDQGAPSFIRVGSAFVHDCINQPVEGLRRDFDEDPLLALLTLEKPLVRQRVRLNARGAAEHRGKFDVTLVPAGTRYSFLLSRYSNGGDEEFDALLDMFSSPDFRLGHGTRSGGGAFDVKVISRRRWDLTKDDDWTAFRDRPRTRAALLVEDSKTGAPKAEKDQSTAISITLDLKAEAGWRVGGGEDVLTRSSTPTGDTERVPDLLPQSEVCIQWVNEKAEIQHGLKGVVLPGSAVKGALRHRLAFHYRRLKGEFADDTETLPPAEECDAVRQILGYAKEDDESNPGQRGRLLIDDIYIKDPKPFTQMHNRIDRFTGGVIDGALFEEELLWQTPVKLKITLLQADSIDADARKALRHALDDLAEGRLPLGASGSRGHGVFIGTVKCEPELAPEKTGQTNEY
ncbi:MAG: RAMP superfamily CRISPR-associated protein [Wenzhouxiangellaceae bacterium]